MLDEAISLNKKSVLIIYIRFQLSGSESGNVSVELFELDDLSANVVQL